MIKTQVRAALRPIKRFVHRLLRIDALHTRIDGVQRRVDDLIGYGQVLSSSTGQSSPALAAASYQIAPWYEPNTWEPTVQLALRDLCRPGDTVFDVGANAGALTVLLSRLVGLRGAVCAFEASRRIVDKTQYNVIVNGCGNVQIFHRAIYHTSGQKITIYHGSHLNDTLIAPHDQGYGKSEVETLSLDDFTAYTKLTPTLIKMDIEGAEFDALRGAEKLIARAHPTFILEQAPDDTRCLELLQRAGYISVDLATYREVSRTADFPVGVRIANVLCIHRSKLAETPYQPPFQKRQVAMLAGSGFRVGPDGSREHPLSLPEAGRYIVEFDFSAAGADNEVMLGVEKGRTTLGRYHAYSRLLAENYRDVPIDLRCNEGASLNVFFRFLSGTKDPTLQFRRVTVSRIENFNEVVRPLVD